MEGPRPVETGGGFFSSVSEVLTCLVFSSSILSSTCLVYHRSAGKSEGKEAISQLFSELGPDQTPTRKTEDSPRPAQILLCSRTKEPDEDGNASLVCQDCGMM